MRDTVDLRVMVRRHASTELRSVPRLRWTDYLRGLLPEGSTVYTQADVEPLDPYGRSLLFVWTASGQLVNLSPVADGYAEAVFIGGNRMLEAQVEAAEDAARAAGLNTWGS